MITRKVSLCSRRVRSVIKGKGTRAGPMQLFIRRCRARSRRSGFIV